MASACHRDNAHANFIERVDVNMKKKKKKKKYWKKKYRKDRNMKKLSAY
jgi:hypothetical protein